MKQTQKDVERSYASQAALKLGVEWDLQNGETPDFIVTEDGVRFGLEVTEVHIGPKSRKGS